LHPKRRNSCGVDLKLKKSLSEAGINSVIADRQAHTKMVKAYWAGAGAHAQRSSVAVVELELR
jgi:hypothetical protein